MSEMLDLIRTFPRQIEEGYALGAGIKLKQFRNIVVTGMGGSGLPGYLLRSYISFKTPIYINRGYDLPDIVDKNCLVVAISYSGNTEETLAAFEEARKKKAIILGITSGGKLHDLCRKYDFPCILIPSGLPPRSAIGYLFFPILRVLYEHNVVKNPSEDVKNSSKLLKKIKMENKAKNLATKLKGKIPLVYASERLGVVAYRWKTQFNENTKIHAFTDVFPEMNHNEIVGFVHKIGNFVVIFLEDDEDNPRVIKRMKITKNLIGKLGAESIEINILGKSLLEKFCYGMYLGDLTSYYLAKLYGVDPMRVDLIEKLKKELGR